MFLLLSVNVLAFAISSQYWEENPVQMSPGESKEITIVLQNMAGRNDIQAEGIITQSGEIASFEYPNRIYLIEAGKKTEIPIKIEIPQKEYQENYNIILSFKTTEEGEGAFGLGNSIEKEIPVIIRMEEKTVSSNILYITIAIAILTIFLLIIFLRKKPQKRKKRK